MEAHTWPGHAPGVLRLPSGRRVRGRSWLEEPVYPPSFSVVLAGRARATDWTTRWVAWPDFWLPRDPEALRTALEEALWRADAERVEVTCRGGIGRTGTALACLAVLDGVPRGEAVAFVRRGYHPNAAETPWQRRFVRRFAADLDAR